MTELFLDILNMSLSASWLVLAVIALRFLLKKAPKWVNVLLWGLVAFRLLCPFTLESALSLIPSAEVISPEIMMDPTPTIATGIDSVNSVVNPVITETFAPEPAASANPLQIWLPILSALWCIGMAAMVLYTVLSYARLRRRVRMAVRVRGNVYLSEYVASPFVLGIFNPRIYLPYHMSELDRHHVLAHERAHIRRRDHWWKPLGFLLLTIHWFNPLMWLAYILLCRDIELACDERVIKELGTDQRADYSQALLHCSITHRSIAACPLAFGEVGVKERVKNVLSYKKPAFWVIILCLIVVVIVSVCFLTNPETADEYDLPITMELYDVHRTWGYLTFHFDGSLSDNGLQISEAYTLEQLVDGGWKALPRLSEAQELRPVVEITNTDFDLYDAWNSLNWEETYGRLPNGTYRIKKDITLTTDSGDTETCPYYAEFTIGGTAEDYVTLRLEDITPTGATLYEQETVEDTFDLIYDASEGYWLEALQDGQWTYLEPTVAANASPSSEKRYLHELIYPSSHSELDWRSLYGELPAGTYRIVREVTYTGGTSPRILTSYAEFAIGPDWGIDLFIDRISENGISVTFLLDESVEPGEFFFAGSSILKKERSSQWTDLSPQHELDNGFDIAGTSYSTPSISLLWDEDMYQLTEGEYRVGIRIKHVLPDGTEEYNTLYEYFDPSSYAWGVSMSVSQVTSTSVRYTVRKSIFLPEGSLTLQNQFTIQKRENNQWTDLGSHLGDSGLPDSPIPNAENNGSIVWEGDYGELPNGTYRLVRYVTRHFETGDTDTRPIYAVFAVDSNADISLGAASVDEPALTDTLSDVVCIDLYYQKCHTCLASREAVGTILTLLEEIKANAKTIPESDAPDTANVNWHNHTITVNYEETSETITLSKDLSLLWTEDADGTKQIYSLDGSEPLLEYLAQMTDGVKQKETSGTPFATKEEPWNWTKDLSSNAVEKASIYFVIKKETDGSSTSTTSTNGTFISPRFEEMLDVVNAIPSNAFTQVQGDDKNTFSWLRSQLGSRGISVFILDRVNSLGAMFIYKGESTQLVLCDDMLKVEETSYYLYDSATYWDIDSEALDQYMQSLMEDTPIINYSIGADYEWGDGVEFSEGNYSLTLDLIEDWDYEIVEYSAKAESFGIRCRPGDVKSGWLYFSFWPDGYDPQEEDRYYSEGTGTGYSVTKSYPSSVKTATTLDIRHVPWSYHRYRTEVGDFAIINDGADDWFLEYEDAVDATVSLCRCSIGDITLR